MNVHHRRRSRSEVRSTRESLARAAFEALEPRRLLSTTDLIADHDAHVRAGQYASTNYGSAATVEVKHRDSVMDNTRELFVRFDLGAVSVIDSATIRLNGFLWETTYGGSAVISAYSVGSTSWTEGALTWNTKPAAGSTALSSVTVTNVGSGSAQWHEWDVTSYVQQEKAAGRDLVSFTLKAIGTDTNRVDFASEEASGTASDPHLRIVAGDVPETPGTFRATGGSPTRVDLTWVDLSNNETGFEIQRKEGTGGTWTTVTELGANVTSYPDQGSHLSPGTA